MKIACDICEQIVDDTLMQIVEKQGEIMYVCSECYVQFMEDSPDEKA